MANTPITRNPQEQRTNPAQAFGEVKDKAHDAVSSFADKAKDAASAAADKAKDAASSLGDKARDAASTVGHKAEDATHSMGSGMQSLAGTIREKMPHDGVMGSATTAVADTLDRGGRYLKEEGLSGIGEDLTNLVRRNPIPALLLALGVGFLIARSTRS